MKATYTTPDGRMSLEAIGDTHRDLFKQLSSLQEVFENTTCGACNSNNVRFVVRSVDNNDFYELHCQQKQCRARLTFGQHKKNGSLFPKRKDEEGKWLENNGWLKWTPPAKKEDV